MVSVQVSMVSVRVWFRGLGGLRLGPWVRVRFRDLG